MKTIIKILITSVHDKVFEVNYEVKTRIFQRVGGALGVGVGLEYKPPLGGYGDIVLNNNRELFLMN